MGAVREAYEACISGGRLNADPGQATIAAKLDDLAVRLTEGRGLFGRRKSVRGLYIWGGVGRGKSMLMDLFFRHAPVEAKRRVHFHDFMQAVQDEIHAERAKGSDDAVAPVARRIADETRLLCFDEFQVSDIADAMVLKRLFEGLLERKVVVVSTSNRVPDALYKDGLNRQLFLPFIDLLKSELDVVEIDAARDYRLERLTEAPVWYTPLGEGATAALDHAWQRLTLGAEPQPHTLTVKGRKVELRETAAGVIRSTFARLCERPLGPADYLAIAAHAHTLILDGVPVLTAEKRNEAKRFVTLIDTLYEARAKLVAAAAAEPEALYPEGDGSFEFQRTVSRLFEMRSSEYLGAEHVLLPEAVEGA
jgi:cell division protein ZapE